MKKNKIFVFCLLSFIFHLNIVVGETEKGRNETSIQHVPPLSVENPNVCTSLYQLMSCESWKYEGADVYLCGYWYDLAENIYGLFPSKQAADFGDMSNVIIADFTVDKEINHAVSKEIAKTCTGKYVTVYSRFEPSQKTGKFLGNFVGIQTLAPRKTFRDENLLKIDLEPIPQNVKNSLHSQEGVFSWPLFYVHDWLRSPSLLQILSNPERFHRHNFFKNRIMGYVKETVDGQFLLFLSLDDMKHHVYGNSILLDCSDCDDSVVHDLKKYNGRAVTVQAQFFLRHIHSDNFQTYIPGRLYGITRILDNDFPKENEPICSNPRARHEAYQTLYNTDSNTSSVPFVSINQLNANPEKYNEVRISVRGFALLNFEYSKLVSCVSDCTKNQEIYIEGDSERFPFWKLKNRQPYDHHFLEVSGVYYNTGHVIIKGPEDIKIID